MRTFLVTTLLLFLLVPQLLEAKESAALSGVRGFLEGIPKRRGEE